MLENKTITLTLDFPGEKKLGDYDPTVRAHIAELAAAMNHEIAAFDRYMSRLPADKGGGNLVPTEANMIRSYIAWKLLYEQKAVGDNKD